MVRLKDPKWVAAGKKAAITRKRRAAFRKARYAAKWSTTMTKWLITRSSIGTKWELVQFVGPDGKESRGIVDILAIRKNHRETADGLKRGDLFEIILIQVKGGSAPWPTRDDIERLRRVAQHHKPKCILLAEWKKGAPPTLYRLKKVLRKDFDPRKAWTEIVYLDEVFR